MLASPCSSTRSMIFFAASCFVYPRIHSQPYSCCSLGSSIGSSELHPHAGYHAELVFVTVKNVGNYPSCSRLKEWPRVRQGYDYPSLLWTGLKRPKD
jgi:hypothetical protein